MGKGYKQPLRLKSKAAWESILKSTAHYLLTLKTDSDTPQLLSTHRRKTFIIGFVATIKSTIEMANEMLSPSSSDNPFNYLLTYKYSQDHIELLFSCIRSRGGWNNNPNSLQLKYALRKMLLRNAVPQLQRMPIVPISPTTSPLRLSPFCIPGIFFIPGISNILD